MAQSNTTDGAAIPYVSSHILHSLDYLKSHGVPDKIDSSVFPNLSGGASATYAIDAFS